MDTDIIIEEEKGNKDGEKKEQTCFLQKKIGNSIRDPNQNK